MVTSRSIDKRSYWYDFSKVAGGNSTIIGDATNWPAFDGRSLSGYQQKKVWLNDGAGKFVDVAQAVGATDTYDGRSVALADLWNRGRARRGGGEPARPAAGLQEHVAPENEWIEFQLEGTASNRSAIGAQVTLYWNGQQQVQQVSGGSGFAAQNDRRLHFGLGKNPQIEKAVIRWPSGKVQTIEQPAARPVLHCEGAVMSQLTPVTPLPRTATRSAWKRILQSRLTATSRPLFITCILLVGQSVVRHSRKLSEDAAGDRHQHRAEMVLGAHLSCASGRIRPALTSPASASAFCCARRPSGLMRCVR